ncbi:hydantoinase B/oxoprolinase family protein [Falsiroseomonas selenitidurans]|uniref:Hydantoinase B/oxoprolinase family protein n=1 Tax=Falsiroseomonas selenitidurans TaxID=2716335 RepID=A0ABX1E257_9PROT|nr:hydantoinase B/oxoprolinase family protein [Falsiroseomonas selenitidurans]NKC31143.1 hydantoinase B/oxoprolinase family protein [Falsiroseomonas selenitidurans]
MTDILSTSAAKVDAVTVEIVRRGLIAVTEEMKTNLMRTAYNLIIYEALDFTVGLFTKEGETVSIGLGLPMFIRGMSETVKAKIRHFGYENIHEGDILVTNDAYTTGSHLNHFTFTMPIFHGGALIGFTCCMAHWLDVGGTLGTVTTDIYSEGIQIPIVKYRKRGEVNQDLVDIIAMNVRLADKAMGDLRAQIVAVTTGERRYLELVTRYGWQAVRDSITVIMDHSEALARANTANIPDGIYEAESFMDDDGLEIGEAVPIRVRVEKRGEEVTIDLSEVAKQVRGFYNSGVTTGIACAQVAFKCLATPTDYPVNEGSFRNLKVIMPMGTVVSAERPAPMRVWMTYPMTVIDTIFKAMAKAIPGRVAAGHHADLVFPNIHGINPADGKFYIVGIGPLGGGWGAKATEDGMSATVCINDGDTHNSPTEQLEAKYPVLVERYALREDSGGAGRFRGGLGCEQVVQALAPFQLTTRIDRVHCKPWGLDGGQDAAGNGIGLRRGGEWQAEFPNAKVFNVRLKAGDAYMMRSGGGGGFGPPVERDPARVAHDVREGYVSRAIALSAYRVVLDATGAVDEAATRRLRAQSDIAAPPLPGAADEAGPQLEVSPG